MYLHICTVYACLLYKIFCSAYVMKVLFYQNDLHLLSGISYLLSCAYLPCIEASNIVYAV